MSRYHNSSNSPSVNIPHYKSFLVFVYGSICLQLKSTCTLVSWTLNRRFSNSYVWFLQDLHSFIMYGVLPIRSFRENIAFFHGLWFVFYHTYNIIRSLAICLFLWCHYQLYPLDLSRVVTKTVIFYMNSSCGAKIHVATWGQATGLLNSIFSLCEEIPVVRDVDNYIIVFI